METEGRSLIADIVTVVVVFGVFLIVAGIFMIPQLTRRGTETGSWGVPANADVIGPEVELYRLQQDQGLPGTIGDVGFEQPMTQTTDSDGSSDQAQN